MRTSAVSSGVGLFFLVLLASCGGNPPGEGDGTADTGDVTDVLGGDTTDVEGTEDGDGSGGADGSDDGSSTGPRLPVGELCLGDDACESSLCFRFDPSIEEGFCTQFCSEESDCPTEGGFSCVLLANSGGDFARVCVPDNLCVDRDEDGYGVGPGCSGPDCDDTSAQVNPAQDELCDAVDNDCDSNIDENPVDANVDCDTGFPGLCSTGRARCNGGTVTCEADRGGQPEICDTLDNDCDGAVDEGADGGPLQEACYGGSSATRDVGACQAGVRSCEDGLVGDCVGQVLPQLEVCDGVDNNCDGVVDEGSPGADQPCDVPGAFGVCARGRTQCDAAGALVCNPLATGTEELCDGQDNDCDGATDEGADGAALQRICYGGTESEVGVGVCATGFETCVGSEYGDCVGDVLPGPELCDTLDNDCDGEVDEDAASGGFVCATGLPGACAVGTTICGGDGTVCIPNEEPSDEVCDAVDNDCDGAIDEDEAGIRLRRACYSGPAGTQGVGLCTGGFQTCGGDGFGVCVDEVRPALEICDGLDNDCDGLVDEGNPGGNVVCNTGEPGVCAVGVTVCEDARLVCALSTEPSTETCDGTDNNCDGLTDEDESGAALRISCYDGPAGSSGVGACTAGVRTCAGATFGSCVGQVLPGMEVCDAVDNDCDGALNEDNPGGNVVCSTGAVGVCAVGLTLCSDGEIDCVQSTASAAETCDRLDNDCDGLTDEDAAGAPLASTCYGGPAGTVGVGICAAGVQTCTSGAPGACVGDVRPGTEICDGLDNDCDGLTDEGNPGGNVVCGTGNAGVCAVGLTACVDGDSVCIQTSPPTDETCDGIDNDCDGLSDEDEAGAPLQQSCYDGPAGTSGAGSCRAGVRTCAAASFGSCVGQVLPSAELCDAVDNDCDGSLNEGNPGGNVVCSTGAAGVCAAGVTLCSGGAIECVQSTASSAETCDGRDNDCDGLTDENVSGAALSNSCYGGPAGTQGEGICTAGVQTCTSGAPGACVGEVRPGTEVCDGLDNDCDGLTDEGNPEGNVVCSTGAAGVCSAGVTACIDGDVECVQSTASSAETCDGRDNDCDGLTDENASGAALSNSCYGGPAGTQGVGLCAAGVQTCTGGVPGACVGETRPGTEVCDGRDNDCDGQADEGNPEGNVVCSTGAVGVCAAGITACTAGDVVCVQSTASSAETCDGRDNDCDGLTDENASGAALSNSCYGGPAGTQGVGVCAAGVQTCTAGSAGVCVGETRPSAEVCDGRDNDCDGQIDEGNPEGNVVCSTGGVGVCSAGITACTAGDVVCVQTTTASAETCDGRDNDCDGLTDEDSSGAALRQTCYDGPAGTAGVGACTAGVRTCTGSGFGSCVGQALPSTEVCDLVDNDCDGTVNDGNPGGGITCTTGSPGVCAGGTTSCVAGAVTCVGSIAPGAQSEICDTVDNDCDGSTNEGFTGLGNTCTTGQGICARPGVIVCASNTSAAPVCSAVAGTPNPSETCDYVDDDCDGTVDEGFRNGSGAYNTVAHCGACGFDCNSTWPGGPALFNVATQCNAAGSFATCGFTCLAGWVNADGVADNGCEFRPEPETVYVSTFANGGRDVAGCGVYTAPCASIQGGIDLARTTAGKTRVRVSTGLYRENIVLANGISVLGGHSNLNWVRNADVFGTSIRGADVASSLGGAADRIVVTADSITSVTEFSGFIVSGVNGGAGGNSVGVLVRNSNANLRIQNNEISAGAGGSGTTGTAGTPGLTGVAGGNGSAAKRDNDGAAVVPGGSGGARSCTGSAVNGGRGGNGQDPVWTGSASPNGSGVNGQGTSPGAGGAAGFDLWGRFNGSCTVSGVIAGSPGTAGANGVDGNGGAGATNASGSLSGILWRAASGANGVAGVSGSGGGGGGASGGVDEELTTSNLFPPGGGGGGSAGCAGASGVGGGGGGASFAVYVVFSGSTPASTADMPTISSNRLRRGVGGKGGDGGTGGGGGEGGAAGSGGAILAGENYSFCLVPGAPGGVGGRGGHAGGGGGGAGGVSYDIWVSRPGSVSPTYSTSNTFDVAAATATGGSGGSGGNSSNTAIGIGTSGVDGASGQVRLGN